MPPRDSSQDSGGIDPEASRQQYVDLMNAENAAAAGPRYRAGTEGDGDGEIAYNSDPRNKQSFKLRYKKSMLIAAAGGTAAIFAWTSVVSQPLQLIHAAEMLKGFHFFDDEEVKNSRATRIWRYMRDTNNPENRRLGEIGKKMSAKIDANFKAKGFEIKYASSGRPDIMRIDTEKLGGNIKAAAELNEMNIKNFETVDGRYIEVQLSRGRPAELNRLNKWALESSGYSSAMTEINNRILRKKIGLSYSRLSGYVKDTEDKTKEAVSKKYEDWKDNRKSYIKDGSADTTIKPRAGEGTDDEGNKTDPTPDDIEGAEEIKENTVKGDVGATKAKVLKTGATVGLVVGIGCLANNLDDNLEAVQYTNVIMPLMRSGMELLTVADQIKSGEGANLAEIGFHVDLLTEELKDENGNVTGFSSWTDAKDVQMEMGKEQTGEDVPKELALNKDDNVFKDVTSKINEIGGGTLDSACGAASSIPGQVVLTTIDWATRASAAGFVVGTAFSEIFADDIFDAIVGWMSDDPIDVLAKGAKYGSFINQGSRYSSNETMIANGGKVLSTADTLAWKSSQREEMQNVAQNQSVYERYLSKENSYSLVSSLNREMPSDSKQAVENIARAPLSVLSSIKMLFPGTQNYAYAAGDYEYPTPDFGFTQAELDDERFENPFENARQLEGRLDSLHEEYAEKCFGLKINEALGNFEIVNGGKSYDKLKQDCPELTSENSSDEFTRYRFYILDTMTAMNMACYEGDEKSCQELGFSTETATTPTTPTTGAASGDPGVDTSATPCPNGTEDGGVQQDYGPGGVPTVKIRICGIPGAIEPSRGVNVSIASQALAMITSMQQAGLSPSGSAFRSYEAQQGLRQKNCPDPVNSSASACSPPTAKPGTSFHEVGLAIDFSNMCYPSSTCAAGTNANYDWLVANASKFGFTKLNSEAWHWSVGGQ
jgi:hypothetical protein